jgi:hypothetical protein
MNILFVKQVQECVYDIKEKQFYQIFKLISDHLLVIVMYIYTSFEDCYNM